MNDLFGSSSEKSGPAKSGPAKSGPQKSGAQPVGPKPPAKPAKAEANGRVPLPGRDDSDYSAKDIEVLEGLEPVRRRPGMYIGGTDETRAAPPRGRNPGQCDGRGGGRPRQLHRGVAGGGRLPDGARQRPRHPGRSASKIQESQRVGGDSDHACIPVGSSAARPMRPRADCMASAVRWSTPCPRSWRSRWRAIASCGSRTSRKGAPVTKLINARAGAQPPRHTIRFRPDATVFANLAFQPGAALQVVPVQGLSVPRRRNPLVL